jgi:hypothetical protein
MWQRKLVNDHVGLSSSPNHHMGAGEHRRIVDIPYREHGNKGKGPEGTVLWRRWRIRQRPKSLVKGVLTAAKVCEDETLVKDDGVSGRFT